MIKNTNQTSTKIQSVNNKWYVINAKNKNLGRLSSKVSHLLKGKNDPKYTPDKINNTNIIIINSKYIKVTGNKKKQKLYKRHSGKPGGLKIENFEKLNNRIPNKIIEHAIKGMLPKNRLGRMLFKKLKVYPENQHPHKAQQPINLDIY